MIHQIDNWLWFKTNGLARKLIVEGAINSFAPPLVITEYPKSGGTWLSQMLSAALDIPYPRNRLPLLQRQVIHGCYLKVHSDLPTVLVWRDGRDTMVSFYYHLVFDKPITSKKFSDRVREELGIQDRHAVRENLPRFIEWAFKGGYPGYSWADFYHVWKKRSGYVETSYERVKADPHGELARVLLKLGLQTLSDARLTEIVEQFSFSTQSNRQPGEEDVTSFVRKGIVGDWKNVFSAEARLVFDRYAGEELVALGYEPNRSWIERED